MRATFSLISAAMLGLCHGIPYDNVPTNEKEANVVTMTYFDNRCWLVGSNKQVYIDECKPNEKTQRFYFEPSTGHIKTAWTGECLDFHKERDHFYIHSCHAGWNQKFYLDDTGRILMRTDHDVSKSIALSWSIGHDSELRVPRSSEEWDVTRTFFYWVKRDSSDPKLVLAAYWGERFNGDMEVTERTEIQRGESTSESQTQQKMHEVSVEVSVSGGVPSTWEAKTTAGYKYSDSLAVGFSKQLSQTLTKTTEVKCKAPSDCEGRNKFQWMYSTSLGDDWRSTTTVCSFACPTGSLQPKCPFPSCKGLECQECCYETKGGEKYLVECDEARRLLRAN